MTQVHGGKGQPRATHCAGSVQRWGHLLRGGQGVDGQRARDGDLAQALEPLQHVLVRRLQQLLRDIAGHLHLACEGATGGFGEQSVCVAINWRTPRCGRQRKPWRRADLRLQPALLAQIKCDECNKTVQPRMCLCIDRGTERVTRAPV